MVEIEIILESRATSIIINITVVASKSLNLVISKFGIFECD